jgi:4-hydroxybenzoate polyprenyltransferase
MPVRGGLAVLAVALASGLGVGARVGLPFLGALLLYWMATIAYSLRLKRVVVLDVIVLAGLYTLRILAGSLATGVPTSSWLFTLSMFFFLSLALVKRTSELQRLRKESVEAASGRGYTTGDIEVLSLIGAASGLVAVLVLALYLSSPDVSRFYSHHERLWLLCPLALYWVSRLWLLAHRGSVDEDPVLFALRDRASYVVGALALAILVAGT